MADTVNIGGKPVNKNLVIGAIGIVMVGGVFYYRKNKATSAAQASVDAAGSSSIDPATGYPYGSAEDAAALSAQDGYIDPSLQGVYGGTGVGYAGTTPTSGNFLNNSEWAQYVEDYEVNTMGADGPSVGNAIGKYITGQPLTTDAMVSIVQSAIAIGGYPPVSGPSGHPPGYVTTVSTPANPASPTAQYAHNPPTGLHIVSTSRNGVKIQWNKVTNAKNYTVHRVAGGGLPDSSSTTSNTYFNLGSLKPNTSYTVQVWADPTPTGGPHAQITVKTTR